MNATELLCTTTLQLMLMTPILLVVPNEMSVAFSAIAIVGLKDKAKKKYMHSQIEPQKQIIPNMQQE